MHLRHKWSPWERITAPLYDNYGIYYGTADWWVRVCECGKEQSKPYE